LVRESHGRAPFGLELRLLDADGNKLPWGGMAVGRLHVRGPLPAVSAADAQGWLDTGDTASLDANGYLLLRDRAEDAIRSGGQWISAVAVERAALAHADVAEAACIAAHHPKFQARPLLLVVARPGVRLEAEAVRRACAARLPARRGRGRPAPEPRVIGPRVVRRPAARDGRA
jgi:acyl-coenzyme A synthetase/AMP-(fatty) acid ligase